MPKVTFISFDGAERTVEATEGESVMRAAVKNGVSGIVGECGGVLSCATCHVFVNDAASAERLPAMSELEDEMLDGAAEDRESCSRLSCQIPVTAETDGLVVRTPEYQL